MKEPKWDGDFYVADDARGKVYGYIESVAVRRVSPQRDYQAVVSADLLPRTKGGVARVHGPWVRTRRTARRHVEKLYAKLAPLVGAE